MCRMPSACGSAHAHHALLRRRLARRVDDGQRVHGIPRVHGHGGLRLRGLQRCRHRAVEVGLGARAAGHRLTLVAAVHPAALAGVGVGLSSPHVGLPREVRHDVGPGRAEHPHPRPRRTGQRGRPQVRDHPRLVAADEERVVLGEGRVRGHGGAQRGDRPEQLHGSVDEVAVQVDKPGGDVSALGVDHPARPGRIDRADCRDAVAVDRHVGDPSCCPRPVHHEPAPDHQIVHVRTLLRATVLARWVGRSCW